MIDVRLEIYTHEVNKMKKSAKYVKIIINLLLLLSVALALIFVVPKVLVFFMPFVIGWIIALIANPLVKFMEKRLKIVRRHGTVLTIIMALALVVFAFYGVVAGSVHQVQKIIADAPKLMNSIMEDVNQIGDNLSVVYDKIPVDIQGSLESMEESMGEYVKTFVSKAGAPAVDIVGSFAKNIPSLLISVIMSILSAYFFVADREKIMAFYKQHAPATIQKYANMIVGDFVHVVGGYFVAQLKIMVVIIVVLFIGFLILDVPFAILLAVLIAFLDMLPFFGTGTALIPWAIFDVLSGDYRTAIGLVILYVLCLVLHQALQPKMVGDTIGLDPFLALLFMFIGWKIKGLLGMIIAIPIGMILINFYKAGVFDGIIKMVKTLIKDFNEFRKWEE